MNIKDFKDEIFLSIKQSNKDFALYYKKDKGFNLSLNILSTLS